MREHSGNVLYAISTFTSAVCARPAASNIPSVCLLFLLAGAFDDRILDPESEYYQAGAKPIELFGITPYGELLLPAGNALEACKAWHLIAV